MHEPYKSNDISCKNTFDVKKVWPSKVESYCITGFLHGVLIFALFVRQNNLMKINSH